MYLMNLSMDSFREKLTKVNIAVLPVGMIEAHGRHCPLGTDMLIPRRFMELLEEAAGDRIIIAPEIPYGHSWSLSPFSGTLNLPSQVLGAYVYHVGLELKRWGLDKLMIFNGHGGNIPALRVAMEDLAAKGMTVVVINWWQDFAPEILEICQGQGHGGEDETSTVLAIDEDLVDMSKAGVNNLRTVVTAAWPGMEKETLPFAQTGDATQASREKGEAIYACIMPRLLELLTRLEQGQLATK
jgi:creatinine amidohydrolase